MSPTSPLDSTDVLVIGGGITGAAIARELSRYRVETTLVEKAADVACGVTKANNGMIHAGISAVVSNVIKARSPGSYPQYGRLLRDRLCMASLAVYERRTGELDVRYRKIGRLVMARNQAELEVLEQVRQAAEEAGLKGIERVDQEGVRRLEPNVAKEAVAGLYDANEAVIFPPELTIALVENAQQNGLHLRLNTAVQGVKRLGDGRLRVATSQGPIATRFVVNAAGLYADEVAALAGETDFHLSFAKGQLLIFDKRVSHLVNRTVCFTPAPNLVRFVSPTAGGNLMAAGTYEKTSDRRDFATTREGLAETMAKARELVPDLSSGDVIASFAGLRATNSRNPEDYIIEPSPSLSQFINVVICPPGLTSAFGVAEMVVGMLAEQGLALEKKPDFNPYRQAIVRFSELSHAEKRALIARDASCGHIVCRCELVTEGEIVEAIRRGATTLDGIKRRTRVGMGRCQGGFDTPRVLHILARELGRPVEEITKMGRASRVAPFRSKELLT